MAAVVELGAVGEPEPVVDGVYFAAVVQQFEDVVDVPGGELVLKGCHRTITTPTSKLNIVVGKHIDTEDYRAVFDLQ